MVYLLDTDSIIFAIRSLKGRGTAESIGKGRRLAERIKDASLHGDAVGISAITRAELEYGATRSVDPARERAALEKVLIPFDEYPFDAGLCARYYGAIRRDLEQKGQAIGAMDLLIAAHALAIEAALVSNNTRHFGRVKGLVVENWSI
jgi:tRNA(fMet)-specific endonuclease VapC